MKVLIVEDEAELSGSLSAFLGEKGFVCETAGHFQQALQKIQWYAYDVIVLDLGLPGGDGLSLLEEIRTHRPETGVLILSARNALDDKIAGLNSGADDYLAKPFHLSELMARLYALIRRRQFQGSEKVRFREIELTPSAMETLVNGAPVELTKKEFDLLLYFIVNRNRVLTKEAIASHLWGDYMENADHFDFIYSHIKNLRRKIGDGGGNDYLQTIYGLGYKFSDR